MSVITEASVLAALRTVQEPELGGDLVTRNMVKDLVIDGSKVAFTVELTTPACPLKDQIEAEIRRALTPIGVEAIEVGLVGHGPARPAPLGRAAGAGRQERDRRRLGQGRRGQEHGLRQPRRRACQGGSDRRPARRRHHGSQHPDDAGHRRAAHREREQQDHPARAPRREGHLDPVLRSRGPAHRVARAAHRRRHQPVPAGRGVGRARLPRGGPAARHLGRPAHAGPGRPDQRHRPRDHAPGGRTARTSGRRSRCCAGSTCRSSASWRT